METKLTARELERYFRKKCAGGRSGFARAFDAVSLRLLLAAAAFLWCRPYFPLWAAAALALTAAALLSLALGAANAWRLTRFTARETRRIRGVLLCDRLTMLSASEAIQLTAPLCAEGETPLPLFGASEATADQLIAGLKRHAPEEKLAVFSAMGYGASARALARRLPERLRLCEREALFAAAEKAGMRADDAAVHAFIRAELTAGKRRRAHIRAQTFAPGGAKRYLLTAAALTLLSFVTRYPLYCRMLAGLSLTLGAASAAMHRTHQNTQD